MGGYSLVEIVIVISIVMIMTAIAMPYFFNNAKMYKTEHQAIKVMDLMREAGQLAITRRRSHRIEIDRNSQALPLLRMINENNAGAGDDVVVKTVPLEPLSSVRLDVAPQGVTGPNPPNYPAAVFTGNVWAVTFRSDGSVVNAAGLPVSATLYFWRPAGDVGTPFNISNLTPPRPSETRAITLFGGSGAVRYWKYTGTTFVTSQ
jgi:type II secretory pathway pseudopilin PulG